MITFGNILNTGCGPFHPFPCDEIYHVKLDNGCEIYIHYWKFKEKYYPDKKIWLVFPDGEICTLDLAEIPEDSEIIYKNSGGEILKIPKRKCYETISTTLYWPDEFIEKPGWIPQIKDVIDKNTINE